MSRLIPRLAALGPLLLLAACGAGPEAAGDYRRPDAMIASAALFDPARFAGTWHVVGDFAPPGAAPCPVTREEWRPAGPGRFTVSGQRCAAGRGGAFSGAAALIGPGRLDLQGGAALPGGGPLWVLWVDADYRVAAVGTPSGGYGMILARDRQARGDLAAAAREVLDFNGYRLAALRMR